MHNSDNIIRTVVRRGGLVQRLDRQGHGRTIGAVTREADGWHATPGGSTTLGPFTSRAAAVAAIGG